MRTILLGIVGIMLPTLEEIGRRRRRLALSQKQLAKLSGVSQSMIAKIEAGRINPSYIKTKSIFDFLESLERRHEVRAKDIVHSRVVSVQIYDLVAKAVKIMHDSGYSQLPVFNGKQAVGSVSEKTIMDNIVSGRKLEDISRFPVEKIMDEAFPIVSEETPVTAISTLLQYDPAVLVVRKGSVGGIITKADLLKMVGS